MRVAFAGTPPFALPTLEALAAQHQLVGVLTQPDRPSGRGRRVTPSAVKRAALERGLPIAQPSTLRTEAAQAELGAWQPEALIVVAYGLLLPPPVLALPRLGCINVHASLLPRWRGAAPVQRALLAGDANTGVTVMQMDAGLDTGAILLQRSSVISPAHTSGSLHDELSVLGAVALIEALEGLRRGTLRAVPQPAQGATYATRIEKAEALIDWRDEALHIERRVRAFNPWPIAETRLDGQQLRIFGARVASQKLDGILPLSTANIAEPGTIVDLRDDHIIVQCGAGQLALTELQKPGRRALPVREFVRGLSLAGRRLGEG